MCFGVCVCVCVHDWVIVWIAANLSIDKSGHEVNGVARPHRSRSVCVCFARHMLVERARNAPRSMDAHTRVFSAKIDRHNDEPLESPLWYHGYFQCQSDLHLYLWYAHAERAAHTHELTHNTFGVLLACDFWVDCFVHEWLCVCPSVANNVWVRRLRNLASQYFVCASIRRERRSAGVRPSDKMRPNTLNVSRDKTDNDTNKFIR